MNLELLVLGPEGVDCVGDDGEGREERRPEKDEMLVKGFSIHLADERKSCYTQMLYELTVSHFHHKSGV